MKRLQKKGIDAPEGTSHKIPNSGIDAEIIQGFADGLVTTATFLKSEALFCGFEDVCPPACQEKMTLIRP
jgi:hypothetical protein